MRSEGREPIYRPLPSLPFFFLLGFPPKRFYAVLLKPDANRCRLMYPNPTKSVPTRSSVVGSGTTVRHSESTDDEPELVPFEANPVHAVLLLKAM